MLEFFENSWSRRLNIDLSLGYILYLLFLVFLAWFNCRCIDADIRRLVGEIATESKKSQHDGTCAVLRPLWSSYTPNDRSADRQFCHLPNIAALLQKMQGMLGIPYELCVLFDVCSAVFAQLSCCNDFLAFSIFLGLVLPCSQFTTVISWIPMAFASSLISSPVSIRIFRTC